MGSGSPLITAVFVTQNGRDRIVKLKVQSMISVVGSKLNREVGGGGARLIKEILNKQKKKGDYGYVKLCTKKVRGGGLSPLWPPTPVPTLCM